MAGHSLHDRSSYCPLDCFFFFNYALNEIDANCFDHPWQIHLKTEDQSTISKFFSKKETKREQEPNLQEGTCDKAVNVNLQKSVKDEHGSGDKLEVPSATQKLDDHIKSNVPIVVCEDKDETKRKPKRDYEEHLADSNTVKNDKMQLSPSRKKTNLKSGTGGDSDKQPTLLSYFNKR